MPIKGLILIMLFVPIIAFYYRDEIYEWLCDEEEKEKKEETDNERNETEETEE